MNPESDCPVVVLASGQTLRLRKVMLYDEKGVQEVAVLRVQAAKGLGPSTGLGVGVLGAPSWEFAAEAGALFLLGSLLSNAAQKTALDYLTKAQEKHEILSKHGVFFEGRFLKNIHNPRPGAWFGLGDPVERVVDVDQLGWSEREAFFQKYSRTSQDISGGKWKLTEQPRFVHNGDEFINVVTDVGYMSIRWSHVVAYFPPQPNLAVSSSAM